MKTKVWIVVWGMKDGGAETLAREYASLVNPDQFDPTLITLYPFTNTANYRRAKEAGLRIYSIFKKRNVLTRALRAVAGKWYVPFVLKRMINQQHPDAIHLNTKMAHYFAPLKKQLSGVKLLYTCHSEVSKHFFKKEEAAVQQLIRSNGLRLIALHDDMKMELDQRFSTDNTVMIRNGVDLRRYREANVNPAVTRQSVGIPQDAYVVGHVGRFSEVKNHGFLLQVFREIAARKPNAHLLLVGSGELQDAVTQEIKRLNLENRVTILSHRTDIPELLRGMDVMVFPSFYEGLSVTLVEAQASGLKCVISDTINPSNILSERTIAVSLNASVALWADIVLNDAIKTENYGDIEIYDMNREIHRLERLYQGESEV